MEPASFGGSSNMHGHLSRDRAAIDNKLHVTSTPTGRYYKEALPISEEMVYVYYNDVQFNEMIHSMRVQHMKNQCAKGIDASFTDTRGGGASLFGEIIPICVQWDVTNSPMTDLGRGKKLELHDYVDINTINK